MNIAGVSKPSDYVPKTHKAIKCCRFWKRTKRDKVSSAEPGVGPTGMVVNHFAKRVFVSHAVVTISTKGPSVSPLVTLTGTIQLLSVWSDHHKDSIRVRKQPIK